MILSSNMKIKKHTTSLHQDDAKVSETKQNEAYLKDKWTIKQRTHQEHNENSIPNSSPPQADATEKGAGKSSNKAVLEHKLSYSTKNEEKRGKDAFERGGM